MSYVIGVDTGGTFTDTVLVGSDGSVTVGKSSSTPPEFVSGVLDSVRHASDQVDQGMSGLLSEAEAFLHGTTIAVNAIVTGSGARIGLLTTKGFGDTVFYARSASRTAGLTTERLHRFAELAKPPRLIPESRGLVREIPERVDWKGAEVVALNEDIVRTGIKELVDEGVEALAVCYLWAFANPEHERRTREIAAEIAPELPVTISSDIAPKMGEYERMSTTGFNCYLLPIVSQYVRKLTESLKKNDLRRDVLIMQGNGGVLTPDEAVRRPVNLVGSGPAGGVLGAKYLGDAMGIENIICTDVGGTSFDVGLIVDGQPHITPVAVVRQYSLHLPLVDVISIGAGGGSMAQSDLSGMARLRVGPESAGADPGPVCYGRGGTEPTVTDADLVLGFINPENFLGGRMKLDRDAATEAIKSKIADPLGMSIEEAAAGIAEIADSHMADLIRQVTVERGYDPRQFSAFLYGGGGPLHGTAYAAKLGVESIVIPGGEIASVFSAWGIASADIHHAFELSNPVVAPFDPQQINEVFAGLEHQAKEALTADGVPDDRVFLQRIAEMRYRLQTHEVSVVVPPGELSGDDLQAVATAFEEGYERLYGRGSGFREAGIEIITFRVHAYGRLAKPGLRKHELDGHHPLDAEVEGRDVYWIEQAERVPTKVYRGERLGAGIQIQGPAIVELPTTTVAVHPDQTLRVDEFQNFVISDANSVSQDPVDKGGR